MIEMDMVRKKTMKCGWCFSKLTLSTSCIVYGQINTLLYRAIGTLEIHRKVLEINELDEHLILKHAVLLYYI